MNQATIAGHLGADPEVRFTSTGQKVTTFRVAARVRRGAKEETIWWRVTVWGEQFDKMISYFKKGSPIVVVGELNKPEIFTDRDGKPQISMSLTAFNLSFSPFGKSDSGSSTENRGGFSQQEGSNYGGGMGGEMQHGQGKEQPAFEEEEIPF